MNLFLNISLFSYNNILMSLTKNSFHLNKELLHLVNLLYLCLSHLYDVKNNTENYIHIIARSFNGLLKIFFMFHV